VTTTAFLMTVSNSAMGWPPSPGSVRTRTRLSPKGDRVKGEAGGGARRGLPARRGRLGGERLADGSGEVVGRERLLQEVMATAIG
jgi:hypothetical protein